MRFVNYHHITIIAAIVIIASGYAISSDVNVVDVIADIMFTPILDAAYAVHGALLSLNATSSITTTTPTMFLKVRGESPHSYQAAIPTPQLQHHAEAGVQILNITDPYNITAAGNINDINNNLLLSGAKGITTFESGGHTYAAVTAYGERGVQILNITDPSSITAAGDTSDTSDTNGLVLAGAAGITTFESGNHTYAAVASFNDGGVQILDVTNPYTITAAGNITDTSDTNGLVLAGATGITTFESGNHTYAAVASPTDSGVQILDVTNPPNIIVAGNITDSDSASLALLGAEAITTFKSGNHTYAAVASFNDGGVQILDVTNPYSITAAGNITGTSDTNGLVLAGAAGITTFESGNHTYAAVASFNDGGVQILDVTNPYSITAAGNITGTSDTNGLAASQVQQESPHSSQAATSTSPLHQIMTPASRS